MKKVKLLRWFLNLFKSKPKWYEDENNFPALIIDKDGTMEKAQRFDKDRQRFYFRNHFYSNICNGWRLATKEEVEGLYYEKS